MRDLGFNLARNALLVAISFCAFANHKTAAQSEYRDEVRAGVEEIYVVRTTRTALKRGATPACAAAPFTSVSEQVFDLWSVEVRADGRVVNAHKKSVGSFTGCFGQPAQDYSLRMYATGTVARISWAGLGECIVPKAQPPVRTVVAYTCHLDLDKLPDTYAGGFLVSSTLQPVLRDKPPTAHVPGYVSTSVVTVRLWRKSPSVEKAQ